MTEMLEKAKERFQGPNLLEVVKRAMWGVWKSRNGQNFENKQLSIQTWKAVFNYEAAWIASV